MVHNFRELKVWSRAMEYVTRIYELTKTYPQDELYELTSQTRRAATSVALNIAEGSGGSSNAEFIRFIEMARRSVYEVITALEIAQRLGYCKNPQIAPLAKEADEIAAMLTGLIKRLGEDKR